MKDIVAALQYVHLRLYAAQTALEGGDGPQALLELEAAAKRLRDLATSLKAAA